ncbi:2Fe-2S iron-sulfur cluster binding domain-containing protein [Desulfosporosinus lacus]|uniref:Uncharacterized protein n=1 Tax=Desulfosporosinus lacus DSM 15449 TaxID=1121420 RepID=A0A1M5V7W1_9FIRM|nr:2Fe-2S iron-sulfur cluster binding domain-containing protein [Desulfosporosinus lacus]SHH71317.1 hypothetical protein SAMN02746098_01241 [Desulfosporosinus lacus DSM 15449]
MELHKIVFLPTGRHVEVDEGSSLMRVMNELGLQSDFDCGLKDRNKLKQIEIVQK